MENRNYLNRREALKTAFSAGLSALGCMSLLSCKENAEYFLYGDEYYKKPARHWKPYGGDSVQCLLCPNQCVINPGERGACRVRENTGGRLYTMVYARLAAVHVDPIEKKPLFHFLPGSSAYSIATAGCNFSCKFCQNWELSQTAPEKLDARKVLPAELPARVKSAGSRVVAFTYNEPTVQFEYIIDGAAAARSHGVRSVIISNGYVNTLPGSELIAGLDAIKIDLKAFTRHFYERICGGSLQPVLNNLVAVKKAGRWLEIVVLVIPTLNDSPGEIKNMCRWIAGSLSRDVPVHFTRFHSTYLMKNLPPTPVSTLERCREIAKAEGIRYPYIGNVPGHRWENTYCHNCDTLIIRRGGFSYVENRVKNGRCPSCAARIPGIWS